MIAGQSLFRRLHLEGHKTVDIPVGFLLVVYTQRHCHVVSARARTTDGRIIAEGKLVDRKR